MNGQGCDKCLNESLTLSSEDVIQKFKLVHGNLYDYSKVNYVHNKTHVVIICQKHGAFNQIPNKHLDGQGCPKCRLSHGEKKIEAFLRKNNIPYISQKTFNDCRGNNKQKLRFDFYLPENNILIEYDGEQHFTPRYFGMSKKDEKRAIERFERVRVLDNLKNRYCKLNKIKLIRISYKKLKKLEIYLSLQLKKLLIKCD